MRDEIVIRLGEVVEDRPVQGVHGVFEITKVMLNRRDIGFGDQCLGCRCIGREKRALGRLVRIRLPVRIFVVNI